MNLKGQIGVCPNRSVKRHRKGILHMKAEAKADIGSSLENADALGRGWSLHPSSLLSPLIFPTAVPSPPRGVISNVNETSLILEWSEPRDLGGRDDLLYNVICKKCHGGPGTMTCSRCDDNVEFVPRQLGLTERRVHISHLLAHTRYTFEVQAVNGVSGKSPLPPRYAAVNITTNQAGEEGNGRVGPGSSSPTQSGVVWGLPMVHRGGPWELGPWEGCQGPRSPC